MSRLFSIPKVGLFLDTYQPGSEKRRGEDVKVITATFRLQPFDAKLATAVDDGLNDNSGVRAALFKLSSAEMKPHIERLNFGLSCPRQNMVIYASPDTDETRIALLQVKISGVYARTQKDMDGFAFVFKGTVGPLGKAELEYLHAWHQTRRFVTFEEAEPGLDFEDDDEGADENIGAPAPPRPTPMWDNADEDEEKSEGEKVAAEKTFEATREQGHRYPKKKAAKKAPKAKAAQKGRGK